MSSLDMLFEILLGYLVYTQQAARDKGLYGTNVACRELMPKIRRHTVRGHLAVYGEFKSLGPHEM